MEILNSIRRRLSRKTTVKSRLAGRIDDEYRFENQEISRMFDHAAIVNGFMAQGRDLFSYVWNYEFETPADEEMRLVLFLQLASQYDGRLRYLSETRTVKNIEYPLIYSK